MSSFQGALNLIKLLDQIRRNNSISVCHFQCFLHTFHYLIFKFLLFALQNIEQPLTENQWIALGLDRRPAARWGPGAKRRAGPSGQHPTS